VDVYGRNGELRQLQEGHPKNYYQVPLTYVAMTTVYDLPTGRYVASLMDNEDKPKQWRVELPASRFAPSYLRRAGRR